MNDRPKVLLVDDEPDILVALEDLLERDYQVFAVGSGAEGLDVLAAHPDVDAIISDQRMPGMTGDAFLEAARGITDAPAILLTGYADLSAVVSALNRGGIVGYAAKPWEPEGLRAMVAGAVDRRRLRQTLNREQALLQGLMDHIPAQVAFKDAEGRFLHVNQRKAEALKAEPAELVGRREEDLIARAPSEAEAQVRAEGRAVTSTSEYAGANGPRWIETEVVPIDGDGGGAGNLAVITRDVTIQKLAEIQARQSDKLRALGTLAGGIAHDFNNLLTAILGSLDLAGRRMDDRERLTRYIENAAAAAQRGAALTRRLLGFSRQMDDRATLVDVTTLLVGARDLMAQSLGPGVTIDWRVPADLWPSILEPDQLELALLNLGVNARDALDGTGEIRIEASNIVLEPENALDLSPGDYVKITVADEGPGMSPETLARVMEPFFTTKAPGKGTGLGLPMAHGFAQRCGGTLDIVSTPGKGTEVSMYLPRADAMHADTPTPLQEQLRRIERKLCVLVVDDEPMVRGVTVEFLRDLGHEVLEAADGAAALDLMRRQSGKVDLAIVDFAMPGMNGVDVAVAARGCKPELPVILLTGYFDLDAVPNDISIMHKPFTDAGLLEAISDAVTARD